MKKPVTLEEFGEIVHKITDFKATPDKNINVDILNTLNDYQRT